MYNCVTEYNDLFESFSCDVIQGLSEKNKTISSKYFYNEIGSQLFEEITVQPEYYLTSSERNIIETYGKHMFSSLQGVPFDLFELGSGNNGKTQAMIKALYETDKRFHYHPIDISPNALDELTSELHKQFPFLDIIAHAGDYNDILPQIKNMGLQAVKVVLFLGSNIGNYNQQQAVQLLRALSSGLNSGDFLLMGMDLKKDIDTMTAAYNDVNGITEKFNLNLLERMNEELGADFNLDSFSHHEIYEPVEGAMKSFLISQKVQTVKFSRIDFTAQFDAFEPISVECSQKYSRSDINNLAATSGFSVVENFTDNRGYFVDSLWQRL